MQSEKNSRKYSEYENFAALHLSHSCAAIYNALCMYDDIPYLIRKGILPEIVQKIFNFIENCCSFFQIFYYIRETLVVCYVAL